MVTGDPSRCPHGRTISSRIVDPCPGGLPACRVEMIEENHGQPVLLRGILPTGEQVLVTLWDEDDAIKTATPGGIAGEVATRYEEGARWGAPSRIEEVPS